MTDVVEVVVDERDIVEVEVPGPAGPPGPPGPSGGGDFYLHEQAVPSAEWVVTHGFGRKAQVSVIIDDEAVFATVTYLDSNTVHVKFASPQTGEVICT